MADTIDPRPIAARDHPVARGVATWLAEKGVPPDTLSIAGLACGLAAGGAFAATSWLPPGAASAFWLAGAICILLRLAARVLSGSAAMAQDADPVLRELYDEVADRISDTAMLVGVGLAAGGNWGLGLGAALAAIATAYVRAAGKAAGAASESLGPMAKQQRLLLVTAVALWSAVAPTTWQPGMAGIALPTLLLIVVIIGSLLTAFKRLGRIARSLAGSKLEGQG